MAQQSRLGALGAYVGRLGNLLGGARHGYLYLYGIVEHGLGESLYLGGHRGREHHGAALAGQVVDNLHYVVVEAHVEHAVGLVENEEFDLAEIDISHLEMCEHAAGSGDYHLGAAAQGALLLCEAGAVGAAVYGERADGYKVGESVHLCVDLHGELAGGSHHDAFHLVGRLALAELVDDGEEECRRFACARLGYGYEVAAGEGRRDCLFLNGGALAEVHVVESVEHIVGQIQFFKSHVQYG